MKIKKSKKADFKFSSIQFSFFLSVIFFAEIVVGVLGFIYKDWFAVQFGTFVNSTIEEYREDPDLQNIIDFTQEYVNTLP